MPEVLVNVILESRNRIETKGLLNSGARDVELVVPARIARKLGVKKEEKCEIFYGKIILADVGRVKASVKNPETGEERRADLSCIILPDEEIDCVVLGTLAQEKFRVIPDTVSGKPIFKKR